MLESVHARIHVILIMLWMIVRRCDKSNATHSSRRGIVNETSKFDDLRGATLVLHVMQCTRTFPTLSKTRKKKQTQHSPFEINRQIPRAEYPLQTGRQ